jgi:DNA-binding transcriptional LysR family regulator
MIDRLRQMAIFAKAVDHGSFRGAANELRLSPSVVSHHISELEAHLGVALLYRTTRKLRLTSEGERLLAATQKMLDAVEGEVTAISAKAGEPSGELRITLPSVLSKSPFIEMVATFMADYPRIGVVLDFSDERYDLIDGGYDIAVRMGLKAKKSASQRKLRTIERSLLASPEFLAGKADPSHPTDIKDWQWLELAPLKNVPITFSRAGKKQSIQQRLSNASCNDAQAIYQLARAGAGLCIVPTYLATEDLKAGRIVNVMPEWELDPIQMYLDWPANAPRAGLIRLFVDAMSKNDLVW